MVLQPLRSARSLGPILAVGGLLSVSWFALYTSLTQTHSADAGIINSLGRLRFLTQNIGLVLLPSSHYYLRSLSSDLRDPSPSQILGTSSRFSEDFLGRERGGGP